MIGFLYPGQGSQKVGMGAGLLEARPGVLDGYLELAEEASELPIRQYMLEGPMESLTRTDVAQPALCSVSLALTDVARELGLRPDYVAGHSLGEYTAAVASGALGSEDGLRLVARRGRLMADIQTERPGIMAAVIGLPVDRLAELCAQASEAGLVSMANLNSPAQVVVSGDEAGVSRLMELAEQAEAKRVVRLQVGAAFHSQLMEPVQAAMAEAMDDVGWRDPDVPLAANSSGELVRQASDLREALIAQIASPVRWIDCVQTLASTGCTEFLELGPGRVLAGLVRQIDPSLQTISADSPEALDEFAERSAA
jgi:[acyl-carrier-protein] S-malonyltransferase